LKVETKLSENTDDSALPVEQAVTPPDLTRSASGTSQNAIMASISRGIQTSPSFEKSAAATQYLAKRAQLTQSPLGVSSTRANSSVSLRITRGGTPGRSYSQQEMQRYIQELDNARTRIAILESEQEQTEASLRNIQAQVFKRFDSPGWKPQCNDDVSRRLSLLETAVKSWAKANSISDILLLDKLPQSTSSTRLMDALDGFAEPPEGMLFMGVPDDKAWVLVQGFVMHQLYEDVFDEPFFGLDHRLPAITPAATTDSDEPGSSTQGKRKLSKGLVETLQDVYEELMECKFDWALLDCRRRTC
jgi:hypothetical protein